MLLVQETVRRHLITEVEVIVNGIPNKVYSQGIETRDMWVEVFRRFGKENSIINAYDFYAGDSSLFPSISGVWGTMIFMEVDWDWWIGKKEFS